MNRWAYSFYEIVHICFDIRFWNVVTTYLRLAGLHVPLLWVPGTATVWCSSTPTHPLHNSLQMSHNASIVNILKKTTVIDIIEFIAQLSIQHPEPDLTLKPETNKVPRNISNIKRPWCTQWQMAVRFQTASYSWHTHLSQSPAPIHQEIQDLWPHTNQ